MRQPDVTGSTGCKRTLWTEPWGSVSLSYGESDGSSHLRGVAHSSAQRLNASPRRQCTAGAEERNVVLVHGLFADGSCWSEVIARLQAAGINATAVQNPLTTLEESVAATQRALALQDGPTVLAGHSFAGMIVTEAGVDSKVTALVYVAARAPDAGEDYTALAQRFPTPPASAGIVWSGDYGQLSEAAFLNDFAGDLPATKGARALCGSRDPFRRTLLAGKTTHAAWRSKPSWYAVSAEDRTINPDLERFMAKRMGATTIKVKASHLSLISTPIRSRSSSWTRPDRHRSQPKVQVRGIGSAAELLSGRSRSGCGVHPGSAGGSISTAGALLTATMAGRSRRP